MAPTIAATRDETARDGATSGADVRDLPLAQRVRTTPGSLRAASVVLVVALLVLGAVGVVVATARADAARDVGLGAGPELSAAQNLYAELAATDAAASASYLSPGLEPRDLRRRYRDALAAAGTHLARVARMPEASPTARAAVRTISEQLPVYAGLVESARANDRQGFIVGAAYLRQASALMREEIITAATTLYDDASRRLGDAYDDGTSALHLVAVAVAAVVTVVLLLAVQWFLAHRMRRVLNLGLVAATVIVVIIAGWTLGRMAAEQSALVDARRQGSDAVQVLSAMRILALRAQNDDQLVLIERGGGEQYALDYDTVMRRVRGTDGDGGLLAAAERIADRRGDPARFDAVREQLAAVAEVHRAVREHDDGGDYEAAVDLATGDGIATAAGLDDALRSEIARARTELDDHASDARGGFGALVVAIPILTLVAAAVVLIGLQPRIEEYR